MTSYAQAQATAPSLTVHAISPLPEKPHVGLVFWWRKSPFDAFAARTVTRVSKDLGSVTVRKVWHDGSVIEVSETWGFYLTQAKLGNAHVQHEPSALSATRMLLPSGADGLPCSGNLCQGQVHPYVEPNQADGRSYLCPSCR